MGVLRLILTLIFIVVCIALATLVLMQEGKQSGLGGLGGASDSYWGKNKGRSKEGFIVAVTKYLAIAFMVLAVLLNLGF